MEIKLDLNDFNKQDIEQLHYALQYRVDDLYNKVELYEHIINRLNIVDCQLLDFIDDYTEDLDI